MAIQYFLSIDCNSPLNKNRGRRGRRRRRQPESTFHFSRLLTTANRKFF